MKRNRILALLLAMTMLFALAACGKKSGPTVVGHWEGEVDMLEMMVKEMDASVGGSKSFGEYLDSFIWGITLDLSEDGEYTLSFDINKEMDKFKSSVVAYMRDVINEMAGMEVSDEIIEQALGMPLEDFAQTVIDDMADVAKSESGKYRDEDGKLIWEDGEESPYVLTEDTLSFSVASIGDLSFHRAG